MKKEILKNFLTKSSILTMKSLYKIKTIQKVLNREINLILKVARVVNLKLVFTE